MARPSWRGLPSSLTQLSSTTAVQRLRSIFAIGLLVVLAAYVSFSGLRLILLIIDRL